MDIEKILEQLNLSKERIVYKFDPKMTLRSTEECVRDELNNYNNIGEELKWLYNGVKHIKHMDDEYIIEQIKYIEKQEKGTPYFIAWHIIFNDIKNRRRKEKITKILKR